MAKVSSVRVRRESDIRDVDVEIVTSRAQAPKPAPSVSEASAGQAPPEQHRARSTESEPDTAHAHSEGVWMEESSRDPAPKLPRPSPIRPATTLRHPYGEVCEIAFWRGYVRASFYARVFDEDGEPVAIAQSPYFRPTGKGEPEATDQAVAAYEALRTMLERAGWEYAGDGTTWFATVFSRPQ